MLKTTFASNGFGDRTANAGSPPPGARACIRSGSTLVELLVALTIITTGLLTLCGGTALVLRRFSLAHVTHSTAAAVASRFARISVSRCDAIAPGTSQIAPGLNESWTAEVTAPAVVQATVTVRYEPLAREQTFSSALSCRAG